MTNILAGPGIDIDLELDKLASGIGITVEYSDDDTKIIHKNYLEHNFTRVGTDRFVNDSPRYWEPSLCPRLRDIMPLPDIADRFMDILRFESDPTGAVSINAQFYAVINAVLKSAFGLAKNQRINVADPKAFDTPEEFISECKNVFSEGCFVLNLDVMASLRFKFWQLSPDDFNEVSQSAVTGKTDTGTGDTMETQFANSEHSGNVKAADNSNMSAENESHRGISENSKFNSESTGSEYSNENNHIGGSESFATGATENSQNKATRTGSNEVLNKTTRENDNGTLIKAFDNFDEENKRSVTDTYTSPEDQGVKPGFMSDFNPKLKRDNKNGPNNITDAGLARFATEKNVDHTGRDILTRQDEVNSTRNDQTGQNTDDNASVTTGSEGVTGTTGNINKTGLTDTRIDSGQSARGAHKNTNESAADQNLKSDSKTGSNFGTISGIENNTKSGTNLGTRSNMSWGIKKDDNFTANLNFERSKRLKEFLEVSARDTVLEVLNNISSMFLHVTIAKSSDNYLGCKTWK